MKRLIAIWIAAAIALPVSAQNREMGGLLMDRDIMMPAELLSLSQAQFNFGTARAMAMAGAFTSLGADASSMSINPAGLGMYRKSEISFTPAMTFSRSSTDAVSYGSNSSGRFSVANFGVILNLVNNPKGLVGLTFGFGYNRLADFNYDYSYLRSGQAASVADVFARQMVWSGVSKNDFYSDGGSGSWNWDRIPFQLWNGALAYRAFMIDQTDPANPDSWSPTWIGNNADITHYTTVKSRGSAGEFTLSVGGNVENKFYFGATIGIQSIHRKLYVDYAEDYVYADPSAAIPAYGTDPSLDYQLLYAKLNQAVIVQGAGVNFKVGMVYRPLPGLRFGVAFHTPTYYSVDRKFQSSAASMAYANRDTDPNVKPDDEGYISSGTANMTSPLLFDESPYGWSFSSPARLMFGASYAFGQRALLSVDYERDWYNGVRLKDNPFGAEYRNAYRDTFRDTFRGANIVRVGAEFKVAPVFALRAGFGYSGSMLRDDDTVLASPIIKTTAYYGAGLGYASRRGGFTLDLAYQYMRHTSTDYYLFYVSETVETPAGPQEMFAESSRYSTTFARHNVALTIGFRF
ncbi:MAG: outer membrane protein transport protein [Alistipes sp.]|nr:outer membrane protein transport protein [Alistipes senegalensis]MCM1251064.1 outer membrane protein transport protein [Alistipes sp.]